MGDYNLPPDIGRQLVEMQQRLAALELVLPQRAVVPWTPATLINGWTNVGGAWPPVGFYKDGIGRVFMRGLALAPNPVTSTTITILPAEYRPAFAHYLPCPTSNSPAFVDTTGAVVAINAVAANAYSLDAVSFRTTA